jgi:protein TonB
MGSGLKATDGEYLPVVKVAPSYPRNAIRRGIEGYVILEYVVLPDGSVTDIRVVEASPPNVFDAAAIRSAKRYKYKPRVENGQAIRVEGVQTKIVFKLE